MPNDNFTSLLRNKQFWTYAGILLCVSVWMFFLGILVGRGTAPIKFDIPKLEKKLIPKRLAAEQRKKTVVEKINKDGEGPDTDSPEEQPLSDSTSASGRYTVQVASLRTEESAKSMADELIKKGFNAFVVKSSSSDNSVWYRVRIGYYKNKSDAQKVSDRMFRESFQPIVVRRQ